MEEITNKYKELIELGIYKGLGEDHGILVTHKGINTSSDSILFVGRELRGAGTTLVDYPQPIIKFEEGDFQWLNEKDKYPYWKSAFWRVIGKSTARISNLPYNYDIFETVYWANLYKIAPKAKKGNKKSVQKLQFNSCADLLINEIEEIKPKCVVFLSGDWIKKYKHAWSKKDLVLSEKSFEKKYYHSSFYLKIKNKKIPAIVVPHPMGKGEVPIIDFICQEFENMNTKV